MSHLMLTRYTTNIHLTSLNSILNNKQQIGITINPFHKKKESRVIPPRSNLTDFIPKNNTKKMTILTIELIIDIPKMPIFRTKDLSYTLPDMGQMQITAPQINKINHLYLMRGLNYIPTNNKISPNINKLGFRIGLHNSNRTFNTENNHLQVDSIMHPQQVRNHHITINCQISSLLWLATHNFTEINQLYRHLYNIHSHKITAKALPALGEASIIHRCHHNMVTIVAINMEPNNKKVPPILFIKWEMFKE